MEHANNPQPLRLIACPHVLSTEKDRLDVMRPPGGTVTDLLRSIGWTPEGLLSARVFIDGELVRDAAWEYTVPRSGQSVIVRAIPMSGGGGSGQGKEMGRMVAMIAIMVVAVATQQYWAAGLAATIGFGMTAGTAAAIGLATISITATLALTGLIPQPLPRRALPQPFEDRKQVAA